MDTWLSGRQIGEKVRLKNITDYQKMALATKNSIPVANWRPKNSPGDQKKISSSQLANENISQRRALHIEFYMLDLSFYPQFIRKYGMTVEIPAICTRKHDGNMTN